MDLTKARNVVRNLLGDALGEPRADLPPVAELVTGRLVLEDLFAFRASVVTDLVAGLADAAGSVPLTYYVVEALLKADPANLWPAGVCLENLDPFLDRAMAMCYVADPALARERVENDPRARVVSRGCQSHARSQGARQRVGVSGFVAALDAAAGETVIYHHGLMTHEHLDWLETTSGHEPHEAWIARRLFV